MIHWFKKYFFPHRGNHHHPHLLRHKSLSAAIAVVVLIELTILVGPFVLPRLGIQLATVLPSVVTLLTNNARAEGHVAEVRTNDVLTLAAQAKALDMVAKGYFAHQSPDGTQPWYWIDRAGYKYQYAGENLAVNFTDSEELVKAWQNSPTHNLNLLGPRYTETGVGVATGMYQGREAVFVVQFFASPRNGPVALASPSTALSEEAAGPVSSPIESAILGTGTQVEPAPSVLSQAVLSPRTYGTYALLVLAGFFLFILLIGWGRHHPRAIVGGGLLVVLLALVIFANKHLILPELKLSPDNQNAATVIYSQ
ncbi:MAG: CAP domain-containing protein [Parcubacteria group bacterium]